LPYHCFYCKDFLFSRILLQAILEVCGIETVLKLWDGISNSPVLAVYSSYGIGSYIGVVLMMKYVKFNPKDSFFDTLNFTNASGNRTLI
jgi:hypothetical protein